MRNDNNPNNLVVDPVAGRITGVWDVNEGNGTTLSTEVPFLLAGGLYFNIHTSDHGGGEIRGQVVAIPEPTAAALACGALVTASARRRRP